MRSSSGYSSAFIARHPAWPRRTSAIQAVATRAGAGSVLLLIVLPSCSGIASRTAERIASAHGTSPLQLLYGYPVMRRPGRSG